MTFDMDAVVTFGVTVEVSGTDPAEARHEVETMSLSELLDFADDTLQVEVVRQTIYPD